MTRSGLFTVYSSFSSFFLMSWLVVHSSISSIGFRLQRPVCFALAPGLATRVKFD